MPYPFSSAGPALQILALVVLLVFLLIGIGVVVLLAALPGRIASRRGHPQTEAINICGWVGLPSGFFWVVALVWAYTKPPGSGMPVPGSPTPDFMQTLSSQLASLETAVASLEQQQQESRT